MPSYLDLGLIAVVLVSALLSMLRGLTREVLAIASWALAAAAAYYFYPLVLPFTKSYIQKDSIAQAVSAGAVFFVTLIVVSLLTIKISDAILDSKVGALDRSLGFLFGAGRGYLLCTIAFVFFTWLVPDKSYPQWVENSKTRAWLTQTGEGLQAMLPQNLDESIGDWLAKRKVIGGNPAAEDPQFRAGGAESAERADVSEAENPVPVMDVLIFAGNEKKPRRPPDGPAALSVASPSILRMR